MNRQEEFEMQLEELIKEFSDLEYYQITDSLKYYKNIIMKGGI